MAGREILLSPEGKKNVEKELSYFKLVRRREVAERIKAAREFGDLSENSEYEDAKNEQGYVENRIKTLEKILRHAKLTQVDGANLETVIVGSTVKVKDLSKNRIVQYTIVGSPEADPSKKRISDKSPVGSALLGQRPGSVVTVMVPAGTFKYEVLGIEA